MTAAGTAPPEQPSPRRVRDASAMRRVLRAISTVLIVAGALMIADAGITLAWQEPVSALLAHIEQDKLSGQLDRIERTAPTPV